MDLADSSTQLLVAHQLLREQRFLEALDVYERVASAYFDAGFALKAIAFAKQSVQIADEQRLAPRIYALVLLVEAYSRLGMEEEATAARRRIQDVNGKAP